MSFLLAQKNKIKLFYPQRHRYLAARYFNSIAILSGLCYKVVLNSEDVDISVGSGFQNRVVLLN